MKKFIVAALLFMPIQVLGGKYYDVGTGKWTTTYPGGSTSVSSYQDSEGRLINQEMLNERIGWRCIYSDGSTLTTYGACPRTN